MANLIGVDKFLQLWKIIRANGGLLGSLKTLYREDDLKVGTLIGIDKYGNKYYENNYYFYGRNRWVSYAKEVGLDYDASQVPPEWFGWLHYKTDLPPHKDPRRPKYKWMAEHRPNMSGTNEAYVPYSTTKPKIQPWKP
ncbi:probable NADH dehydrogenase [ubiquinone] 1 alpha subcomplex subunit 12 [Orussus abietinus]|uniref:probable NADH dehydrogenase [ubiquinone] 1 alpha subcomplex subunit 12 n=1 Tax=Orussus abietinus TaxID=222816 RepID=UPI0006255959|nr:probable NADH dehydrogenase [ubiquinone] 1 alpha subcomplex subunit 12 [Orussus abietinus]